MSFPDKNSGYSGHSMSVRAVEAYESGQMPLSYWTKTAIIDAVLELDNLQFDIELFKKLTKKEMHSFLEYAGWHHTGEYCRITSFYKIDVEKINLLRDEKIKALIALRKVRVRKPKEEHKEPRLITALCRYDYYTGTGKWRRRKTREEQLSWVEGDKLVATSEGTKRLSNIFIIKEVK